MNDDSIVLILCKLNAGDPVDKRDWRKLLAHFKKANPYLKMGLLKNWMREMGIIPCKNKSESAKSQ